MIFAARISRRFSPLLSCPPKLDDTQSQIVDTSKNSPRHRNHFHRDLDIPKHLCSQLCKLATWCANKTRSVDIWNRWSFGKLIKIAEESELYSNSSSSSRISVKTLLVYRSYFLVGLSLCLRNLRSYSLQF